MFWTSRGKPRELTKALKIWKNSNYLLRWRRKLTQTTTIGARRVLMKLRCSGKDELPEVTPPTIPNILWDLRVKPPAANEEIAKCMNTIAISRIHTAKVIEGKTTSEIYEETEKIRDEIYAHNGSITEKRINNLMLLHLADSDKVRRMSGSTLETLSGKRIDIKPSTLREEAIIRLDNDMLTNNGYKHYWDFYRDYKYNLFRLEIEEREALLYAEVLRLKMDIMAKYEDWEVFRFGEYRPRKAKGREGRTQPPAIRDPLLPDLLF